MKTLVDETYVMLYYGDVMPVFGTNSGATTGLSHVPGYLFAGWSPSVPSTVPDVSTGVVTVLTYTAQWSHVYVDDEFYLTYNGNGNTGGVVPVDFNNPYLDGSQVIVLGKGSLSKVGSVFVGWSTSATAVSAEFTAGSTFTIYDDVVLYAVWAQDVYTVTYEPGMHGTFNAQVTSDLHYGDVTPVAPTVTGETGWTFTGWSPVPSTTVTGDAAYVAQWTQIMSPSPCAQIGFDMQQYMVLSHKITWETT